MRPDVMAVIHAHSAEMITFAAAGVPLRNMIHTGNFINDGVPVWDARKFGGTADDMLIRNPALGKALAGALAPFSTPRQPLPSYDSIRSAPAHILSRSSTLIRRGTSDRDLTSPGHYPLADRLSARACRCGRILRRFL
jgi:hypothetical protein